MFLPCNGAANNQPKFVSPPINLLNVFENSGGLRAILVMMKRTSTT